MPHDWHGEFDKKHGPALWGCAGWAATVQAANERSAAYQNKSDLALPVPGLRVVFVALSLSLLSMPSTFDFCIPTRSTSVPNTPDWLHEVKYDGYTKSSLIRQTW